MIQNQNESSSGVLLIVYDDQFFVNSLISALRAPSPDLLSSVEDRVVVPCLSTETLEQFLESDTKAEQQIGLIIIQAEFGKGERYRRRGIELLEHLRRDRRLLAPAIVISLCDHKRLIEKHPIIQEEVSGSYFIRAPFALDKLREMIATAESITTEQLRDVVMRYCHLEQFLSGILHDIINAIRADKMGKIVELSEHLEKYIRDFLPGRFGAELGQASEILKDRKELNRDALGGVFFDIRDALRDPEGQPEPRAKATQIKQLTDRYVRLPPPAGLEYILVVDDDGYDRSCQLKLEDMGYGVEIITSRDEALSSLEIDPPDILLCDLRLEGDPQLGLEVARSALSTPQIKLVIMISADEISEDEVPEGVEVCAGRDKFNVELIHALICNKAES